MFSVVWGHYSAKFLMGASAAIWLIGIPIAAYGFRYWLHNEEPWTNGKRIERVFFSLIWPGHTVPMCGFAIILLVGLFFFDWLPRVIWKALPGNERITNWLNQPADKRTAHPNPADKPEFNTKKESL